MDCPIDRNARCDRKAVFSVADGRLQTSIKPKLPIVARQPRPRIDGARNGNAVRAGHLDSRDVPVLKELERQPRGSMTRAIDADDISAAHLDERKEIAADPSNRGLANNLHSACTTCVLPRLSPRTQTAARGPACPRMGHREKTHE